MNSNNNFKNFQNSYDIEECLMILKQFNIFANKLMTKNSNKTININS